MPLRLTNYSVAAGYAVVSVAAIVGTPFWLLSALAQINLHAPQILEIILLLAILASAIGSLPSITVAVTLSERVKVRTLFQTSSYDWKDLAKIDIEEESSTKLPWIKRRFATFEFRPRKRQLHRFCKVRVDANGERELLALLRTNDHEDLLHQPGTGTFRLDSPLGATLIILFFTFLGALWGWWFDVRPGKNFIVEGSVVGACIGVVAANWAWFHFRKNKS
ncbi:MAG: hypothetical protein HYY23_14760 [Verrucomicrobia bacterium]|nr:hypothetical protein [Verrucomicrobiota bacterium]